MSSPWDYDSTGPEDAQGWPRTPSACHPLAYTASRAGSQPPSNCTDPKTLKKYSNKIKRDIYINKDIKLIHET